MKTQWLVAKYMPDLMRREPINVGVAVHVGGRVLSKFQGQREDGSINGQLVQGRIGDLQNYKSWVASWRYAMSQGWDLAKLTRRSADQNYYLEFSGEQLVRDYAQDAAALLDQLYQVLVDSEVDDVIGVHKLSERIFKNLKIFDRIDRDVRVAIPSDSEGAIYDEISFDYKFQNSATNLFKEIALSFGDARTWNVVHAAAWSFDKAYEYARAKGEPPSRAIALVKPRDKDRELVSQLGLLRKHAAVVNVADEDSATRELATLLHIAA